MLPLEKDPLAPGDKVTPHKVEPAKKTWFFQRENGTIFSCDARVAHQTLNRNSNHLKGLKLIGCSDGTIFQKAVLESQRVYRETQDLAKAQAILRQGELDEIERARGNIELPPDLSAIITKKSP